MTCVCVSMYTHAYHLEMYTYIGLYDAVAIHTHTLYIIYSLKQISVRMFSHEKLKYLVQNAEFIGNVFHLRFCRVPYYISYDA